MPKTTEAVTLRTLTDDIRRMERELAPGSETPLWGDYCEDIRRRAGVLPYDDFEGDPELPAEVADYWRGAYKALASRTEVERILSERWLDPEDYLREDGSYRLSYEAEYGPDGEPTGDDVVEELNKVLPEGWDARWLGYGNDDGTEDLVVSPPEE